jgi:hypothetical protein
MSKQVDWIIHYVASTADTPATNIEGMVNVHTHGLEKHGHSDIQLVVPIAQKQAMDILNTISLSILDGKSYDEGYHEMDGVLSCGCWVEAHQEVNRVVLRFIFPDPKMRFPWDAGCEHPYNQQQDVNTAAESL